AIGDDGKAQLAIRTLHRTGYRFVGEVAESPGGASIDVPAPASSARATDSEPNTEDGAPAAAPNSTGMALQRRDVGGAETAPPGIVPHGRRARRGLAPLGAALAGAMLATALYWALSRDSDMRWFAEEAVAQIEAYLNAADWES